MNTHNEFNGATVVLINHRSKHATDIVCSFIEFFLFQMPCMHEYYRSTQSNFTCLEVVWWNQLAINSISHLFHTKQYSNIYHVNITIKNVVILHCTRLQKCINCKYPFHAKYRGVVHIPISSTLNKVVRGCSYPA